VIGSVPVQVPLLAVNVWPSVVVPEIVGGAVLFGTTADAASPGPVTSPAATTAITEATATGIASNVRRLRGVLCLSGVIFNPLSVG